MKTLAKPSTNNPETSHQLAIFLRRRESPGITPQTALRDDERRPHYPSR